MPVRGDPTLNSIGFRTFHRLLDVVPGIAALQTGDYGKSDISGYMALNLDVLFCHPGKSMIALSHLYKHPSGDMIPDPDMQITVYPEREYAEAVSYQDFFGYQSAEDGAGAVHARVQRELNSFLYSWLGNLIEQGHCIQLRSQCGGRLKAVTEEYPSVP
jgi:uncharacterized protein YqiB (DUF1249 family)